MFANWSLDAACIAFSSEWIINRYCIVRLLQDDADASAALDIKDDRGRRVSTATLKESATGPKSGPPRAGAAAKTAAPPEREPK